MGDVYNSFYSDEAIFNSYNNPQNDYGGWLIGFNVSFRHCYYMAYRRQTETGTRDNPLLFSIYSKE